jgi:hypothetical protein
MTSNPLQVLTALHARPLDFPSWVDPAILRYTLVVHPHNSNLSDEEYVLCINSDAIAVILPSQSNCPF